jgi:hypothetical protein
MFLDLLIASAGPHLDSTEIFKAQGMPLRGKMCLGVYGEDKFGNQLKTEFHTSNFLNTNINGYATNLLGLTRGVYELNYEGGQNYKNNPMLGECFNLAYGNAGVAEGSHAEGGSNIAWGQFSHIEGYKHAAEMSENF